MATAAAVVLSRALSPAAVTTREPAGDGRAVPKAGRIHYLNVNLSYEVWKDINFSFLQITHPDPLVYFPKLIVRWCGLNSVVFALLYAVCRYGVGWTEPLVTFSDDSSRS